MMSSWIFNTVLLDHQRSQVGGPKKNRKILFRSVDQFSRHVVLLLFCSISVVHAGNIVTSARRLYRFRETRPFSHVGLG